MLISALTITGTLKQAPLARLVLNCQEAQGDAVGMTCVDLAERLGVSRRTIVYWTRRLEAVGIVRREDRTRHRGGCRSNLLAIDLEAVARIATDRAAKTVADRAAIFADRAAIFAAPIRNILPKNLPCAKRPNPPPNRTQGATDTVALEPNAWEAVGVELGLCGVEQAAKAIASLARHGGTPDIAREIAACWRELRSRWREAHQPVKLYRRLLLWRPGQSPRDGWPPADDGVDPRIALARRIGKI